MKIREAIERIEAYHAPVEEGRQLVDGLKIGDPDAELTGIATTCSASVDVIRKAAEAGCNFIVCHEPVFYTTLDNDTSWLEGKNEVFEKKSELCRQHGIAIYRDHDRIHNDGTVPGRVDGIYYGVMCELGWEQYLIGEPVRPMIFDLPETTVRELALFLKDKIHTNGVRVIGNPDASVSKVALYTHVQAFTGDIASTELLNRDDVDVMIPLELIDWSVSSYARDAEQLGMNKAILNVGHFNAEELGMKYAVRWISEIMEHKVPVEFIASADIAHYIV